MTKKKGVTYSITGTTIPSKRISKVWSSQHPRTKQPPINGYFLTHQELIRVSNESIKKKGPETKEYGKQSKKNPRKFFSKTQGMLLRDPTGKYNTILIQKGMPKSHETVVIKHELNHVYEKRRKKSR
jgi:hypothetical protein